MPSSRIALVTLTLALASAAGGRQAEAAFTQATCTSGSYDTAVPVRIGTDTYDRDPEPIFIGPFANKYLDNDHHVHKVMTNANVDYLQGSINAFDLETNYDFMTINGTAYTGAYSASAPFAAWRTSTNSRTLQVSFDTDTSVTRNNGTYIYQVQPKCFASVQTTASWGAIPVNVRTDGVLIKTGDVI